MVANKVMGWRPSTHKMARAALAPPDNIEGFYTQDDLPAYSNELHAAQDVIERMRADGFSFKAWQPAKEAANYAKVSFICGAGPCPKHGNPHHNHHGAYDVDAGTLPLAICKAALIALEAKDDPLSKL